MSATRLAAGRPAIPARACGAIALGHVLRRFGIERSLADVWDQVAMSDPFGTLAARSYRLAGYAIACGLNAVTVQCHSERWRDALQYVDQQNLSVILNHTAVHAPDEGHFSVLTGVNEATVEVEDPFKGPGQHISLERMRWLWQPNRETVGFILVAIGPRASVPNANARSESPSCPGCDTRLPLAPSQMFVERDWQADGLWQRFFCHNCDAGFTPRTS